MFRCVGSLLSSYILMLPLLAVLLAGCGSPTTHNTVNTPSPTPVPGPGPGGGGGTGGGGTGGGGTGGGGTGGGGTGGGGGTSGTSTVRPEFLYAVAYGQQGSVYEFKIDPATGKFTAMAGSPFKADVGSPTYVCTVGCEAMLLSDPLNRFVYYQYAYDSGANGLDALQVNQQSGALSSGSRYSSSSAYEPTADPQGRFVYWNDENAVGGASVSSTGQLATLPGQPYGDGGTWAYGAPAVTNNYVFLINAGTGMVEYTIDPSTGTLTRTGNTVPLNSGANPLATPDGKFVYVEQMVMVNGVGRYQILPVAIGATGTLTLESQYAQQTTENGAPYVWMSPNGKFLYAEDNGTLLDFQINQTTGALTLAQKYSNINTSLLAIDPEVQYVYLSPAYASNLSGTTLTAYSVNPDTGELTAIPNSTVNLPSYPIGLAVISPQ